MLKLSTCLRNAIAMFALVLAFTVNSFAQEVTMEQFDIELFDRNKTGQLVGTIQNMQAQPEAIY